MKKNILNILFAMAILIFMSSVAYAEENYKNYENTAISRMNALLIMQGTNNGFEPNKSLTRAEITAILTRMYSTKSENDIKMNKKQIFDDVSQNHWANGYIAQAVELGLLKGVGDNKFMPEKEVSLAELYTIASRAIGADNIVNKAYDSAWPINYYLFCSDNGLCDGIIDPAICNRSSNRAEAAIIVNNILKSDIWILNNSSSTEDEYIESDTTFSEKYLEVMLVDNAYVNNFSNDTGRKYIKWGYNKNAPLTEYKVLDTINLSKVNKNEYYNIIYDMKKNMVICMNEAVSGNEIAFCEEIKDETNDSVITVLYNDLVDILDKDSENKYVGSMDQKLSALCENMLDEANMSFKAKFSTASCKIVENEFYNGNTKKVNLHYVIIWGFDKDGNFTDSCRLNFNYIFGKKQRIAFNTDIKLADGTVTYGLGGYEYEFVK